MTSAVTEITIAELARSLALRAEGDLSLVVRRVAEPQAAGPEDLALAMDPRYIGKLAEGQAKAAVLWEGADWRNLGLKAALIVGRPRLAMAGITRSFDPGPEIPPGIHPMSVVDPTAEIGEGAAIGPFVSIGAQVKIGARARIGSHVSIAEGAVVGEDALILQGARLCHRIHVGDRVIIHPGAVIGADGFSFVTPEKSGVEQIRDSLGGRQDYHAQRWVRISSLGWVVIGDDVEIGANATIDRGTVRATTVGRGTKIDNLVHVGHNVQVGEDCLLCGQVGVAGSTRIGDRVVLGGQCGVSDNISIGNDVIAGGATKIFSNVPAGRVILGSPAVKMETQIEINKAVRRLPRMAAAFAELQKTVTALVDKAGGLPKGGSTDRPSEEDA